MDLRARRKLAFVVERYGAEEPADFVRRTRALASTMADRGHDVTVLTTCARLREDWTNEYAEGESSLDGVRVVRFATSSQRKPHRERVLAHPLAQRSRWARLAWAEAAGPVAPALDHYLRRFGALFDAVLFTGAWTALPVRGMPLVRFPVLAPAPLDDPSRECAASSALLSASRGLLVATPAHADALAARAQSTLIGSCAETLAQAQSPAPFQAVRGPYILYVGDRGPHVGRLAEAFRLFRDGHARTPFEDDVSGTVEGRDLWLVLAGDFAHQHAPADRIVSLGPVDDHTRRSLLGAALAVMHCDRRLHMPVALVEAWTMGRPVVLLDPHPLLSREVHTWTSDYRCDASSFASCLASLLARRGPRAAMASSAQRHARRAFDPGTVASALDACIEALRSPSAA